MKATFLETAEVFAELYEIIDVAVDNEILPPYAMELADKLRVYLTPAPVSIEAYQRRLDILRETKNLLDGLTVDGQKEMEGEGNEQD